MSILVTVMRPITRNADMVLSLLAAFCVAASAQAPDSAQAKQTTAAMTASLMPQAIGGMVIGGAVATAYHKPGLENLGNNILLLGAGMIVGTGAGSVTWTLTKIGAPPPTNTYWLQDATAGSSLLLSGIGGLGTRSLEPLDAARWGVGLQAAGLVVQRQVLTHWGRDSARLALLTGTHYANLHVAILQMEAMSMSAEPPELDAAILPLALHPASYLLALTASSPLSPTEASACAEVVLAAGVLIAPLAGLAASEATAGDLSASVTAAASAEALGLAIAPFVNRLPGNAHSRGSILKGSAIGSVLGMSLVTSQANDVRRSPTQMSTAHWRRKGWQMAASGAVLGSLAGGLLSLIPAHREAMVELVPPGPAIASDGSLALGTGGIVAHLR